MPMTPEEKARQQIDASLALCGWTVQDKSQANLHAAHGVALSAPTCISR
jgi:type I site-specific restriction endonuclease